jgi:hypothetical protein
MDYVKIYQAAAQNSKKTLDTAIVLNKVYQKIEDQTLKEKFGKNLHYRSVLININNIFQSL